MAAFEERQLQLHLQLRPWLHLDGMHGWWQCAGCHVGEERGWHQERRRLHSGHGGGG